MTFTIRARVDARGFDLELTVADGETVAVLGPNGAGKSTLLAIAAGLLTPDSGRATLDGQTLFDLPGTRRGASVTATTTSVTTATDVTRGGGAAPRSVWIAPHARSISLLAQEALLFPHLSVLDNVAFGPRSLGLSIREARRSAIRWLDEVDARDLAARRPTELSGGQAQRIALARALASEPSLLLLDEPLSALDVAVAPTLRRTLRRVLEGRSAIIVTHDILDAYLLADTVVIVEDGRIVEQGSTAEVFERPRSGFAADLVGLVVVRSDGETRAVRPSAVTLSLAEPVLHADRTVLMGQIRDIEPRGDVVRVHSESVAADLHPRLAAELDLVAGQRAWFSFVTADAVAYTGAPTAG
ncbi:ATP-binding cassette domain-containing protein [Subtercola sp. PAMC28395]|uniref:sulfate/molybdate ABC transporter ATP-binding protein n=1 Tax=Subtercola sp. PAMC28395 TaxID=2846775 RepID=UPI001C0D19F1|nr:ATP-binding cassette domain-containing protein [Subtercola sp. PAMC28395]QWT23009.1 ATP-binding cassette domain-containing protein [Subtercola sp. PAMC28395]